jgi:hypothetical protein
MWQQTELFSQQIVLQRDFNFCLAPIDCSTVAAWMTTVEFACLLFSNLISVKYLCFAETVTFLLHLGRHSS